MYSSQKALKLLKYLVMNFGFQEIELREFSSVKSWGPSLHKYLIFSSSQISTTFVNYIRLARISLTMEFINCESRRLFAHSHAIENCVLSGVGGGRLSSIKEIWFLTIRAIEIDIIFISENFRYQMSSQIVTWIEIIGTGSIISRVCRRICHRNRVCRRRSKNERENLAIEARLIEKICYRSKIDDENRVHSIRIILTMISC